MRDWNIRSLRIIRTVADLGLMVLLAWGATVGINHIYGLGGRREVTQRLNPVLVQTYDPIPPGAQPYFSFKSRNILGEVVIVIHERTMKIESSRRLKPQAVEYEFLASLAPEGAYQLFVKPILGRGFITSLQNLNAENSYTAKIKIHDPYFDEGEYQFEVWYTKADGDRL